MNIVSVRHSQLRHGEKGSRLAGRPGRGLPFHDFKKQGVPGEQLDGWISQLGWERPQPARNDLAQAGARSQADVKDARQRQGTDAAAAQRDQAAGRGMGRQNHGRLRCGGLGVAWEWLNGHFYRRFTSFTQMAVLAGRMFLKLQHR